MSTARRPRLAFLLLKSLSHFAGDLIAGLPDHTGWDVRPFTIAGPDDLAAALAWTDRPDTDALWFEFCWPPFPRIIADTDFAGRRVIVRVHRIEATETPYVAQTPWHRVQDLIVVSAEMAARVRRLVPDLDGTTRLHCIHNGLDLDRFTPLTEWNRFRIGWCGLMTTRKNPTLALQVLAMLRDIDDRYHMHLCSSGGDALGIEPFLHLAQRLGLTDALQMDGSVTRDEMPAWHGRNGVLLHTSLHESFGYAIAEAAAVGCDIAVMEHMGAEEFWPSQTRFCTIEKAARLICEAAPHRWRAHVVGNFSLSGQLAKTAAMLLSGGQGDASAARPIRSASPAVG